MGKKYFMDSPQGAYSSGFFFCMLLPFPSSLSIVKGAHHTDKRNMHWDRKNAVLHPEWHSIWMERNGWMKRRLRQAENYLCDSELDLNSYSGINWNQLT